MRNMMKRMMRRKPERSMGRPQAARVAAGVTIFCAGMLLLSAPVAQAQVKEYGVSELASLALRAIEMSTRFGYPI